MGEKISNTRSCCGFLKNALSGTMKFLSWKAWSSKYSFLSERPPIKVRDCRRTRELNDEQAKEKHELHASFDIALNWPNKTININQYIQKHGGGSENLNH